MERNRPRNEAPLTVKALSKHDHNEAFVNAKKTFGLNLKAISDVEQRVLFAKEAKHSTRENDN